MSYSLDRGSYDGDDDGDHTFKRVEEKKEEEEEEVEKEEGRKKATEVLGGARKRKPKL